MTRASGAARGDAVAGAGTTGHRLARRLHGRRRTRLARGVTLVTRLATKVEIDPAAEVADDVVVVNGHGLVVGAGARVGPRCVLHQGVSLVAIPDGAPQLGSDVVVLPGAVLVGPVVVGDGARIEPNAVVVDDVPAGATASGVPASSPAPWLQAFV